MTTPNARDDGLRRVSRLTGWMAVGALAGVGAFAGLLAAPHPTTSTNGTTTKVATSGATKSATAAVKTPAQAPVASRQRSVAVSGGS